MVLDLSIGSLVVFLTMMLLLVFCSIMDIRSRRVTNRIVVMCCITGLAVALLAGRLLIEPVLHLSAVLFAASLSYVLFRLGALGGADVKLLCAVALISPGTELSVIGSPLYEAVLSAGFQMSVMLLGGYLCSQRSKNQEKNGKATGSRPPLIPFLLVGYSAAQLLAVL